MPHDAKMAAERPQNANFFRMYEFSIKFSKVFVGKKYIHLDSNYKFKEKV